MLIYEKSSITDPQAYAFIRGRLMSFGQLGQYRIYEDGQYVCYDVSHLFYSDLRSYVESMAGQRNDAYFDEQVWERVQNIYSYYRENLGALRGYRDFVSPGGSGSEGGPNAMLKTESCLDNPENPVSGQGCHVGEPNWNDYRINL